LSSKGYVTIKTYDSTDEAKAAEAHLIELGLSRMSVSRSGKKIRVDAQHESAARTMIEGATPSANGGSGMTDVSAGSTSGAYGMEGDTSATNRIEDTTSSVAETVQEAASSAVDTAQQAVGAVADKVQDATSAVSSQVADVTDTAADKVQGLANTVWESGTQPGAPAVQRQAAQAAVSVLDKTAEYLRERDLSLILEDVRSTIRRNPGRALLLGLGLGYLARGTFFPSTGGQGQQGRMGSPMPAPQPRAVPVYSGESNVTYGAGYDTASTGASTLGGDIAPLSDMSTLSTADVAGSDIAASTMTDTGVASDLSPYEIDALAGGSDDTATSLYGSDVGTDAGLMTGGTDELGGTDAGMSAGGVDDLSSITSGDQFASSGLEGGTLGGSDAGSLGTIGSLGDSGADDAASTGGVFGTGDQDATAGDQSASTTPDNDLLGQWDAQTRRTDS